MKVTIKKWNTVATWRWDIPEDDATIAACYRGSAATTFTCTAYWNGSSKIHQEGNAPCVVNALSGMNN
ncbi:hypothetical protein Forpe1208_v001576 [Fusarium oxysporum f. sp. rapae]|uniref:Anaphase-promoting complex subunit 11 RING-H2 finger domain-containing protein n=1 Tax=Fusarium oxysporum f. sp. rapae TaxID=485398 RepID=A0A8J5U0T7_FUSOX|nr:hypothetical protein Forpe1208_v001576 [Fusarium oxysporum f. sp. rapae]